MKKKITLTALKSYYHYIITFCLLLFFAVSALLQKENLSFILIAFAFLLLLFSVFKKHRYTSPIISGTSVFLLAFVIRFAYCTYVAPYVSQISDFDVTLAHAWTGDFTDRAIYFASFPHKIFYPLLLHILRITTQNRIFLFQSILSGVVALLLYKICSFFKNRKIAPITALLYSFWPSQVVYTQIISEEHIATALILLIFLLSLHLKRRLSKKHLMNTNLIRSLLPLSFLIGILLGLQALFKDWGSVYIFALALCLPYLIIKFKGKKKALLLCASFVIILLGRFVATSSCMALAEHILGGIKPNSSALSWQFFETMDPDSTGSFDAEKSKQFSKWVQENSYNYNAVNRIAFNDAIERMKAKPIKTARLLFRKIRTTFKNNADTFYWVQEETEPVFYSSHESLWSIIRFSDNVYYVVIIILMLLAALTSRGEILSFSLLITLGCGLACFFVESQPRYKVSIEPLWCIPAGYAITYSFYNLEQKYLKLRSRLATKKSP